MRIIFLGSGEFGLPTLQRLARVHEVLAVVTQPDRPAGRHRHLAPTPIGQWAARNGVTVTKVNQVNAPDTVGRLRALQPEAGVVIAFGQKLGPEVIGVLGRLAVNLHGSLLPRYRGAAPINWAIINGETETGLSVISLADRMDAGLIYAQARTPIGDRETAGELHDRLAAMGPDLIDQVLQQFAAGTLVGTPQDDTQTTRAPKLSKADAHVDFDCDAHVVAARVHGLTPWPGVTVQWQRQSDALLAGAAQPVQPLILRRVAAEPDPSFSTDPQCQPAPGTILEGHRIAVRGGAVRLLEVQLPGGRPMPIDDFARGHPLRPGDSLRGIPAV